MSIIASYQTAKKLPRTVFFEGSTALVKGTGVCFNRDYGTAADTDENRDWRVEVPSSTNNLFFAGVTARAYSAVTGGQLIEIYEPGSVCEIYVADSSATVAATRVTCNIANGKFYAVGGFPGRGTAIVLETISAAGTCLAKLDDGEESGLYEALSLSDIANAATTFSPMVGGMTRLPYANLSGGNCVATIANATGRGLFRGFKKTFYIAAAPTTCAYQLSLAAATGFVANATAVSTATSSTIATSIELVWRGEKWEVNGKSTGWSLA